MAKTLLKIAVQDWVNASRDKRELSAAIEAGFEVRVMARGAPGDRFRRDEVEGFEVYRFSTRPLAGGRLLLPVNRLISLFSWARCAGRFDADVISGHDFIALFIGYLSCCLRPKEKRPKLVYDSHEFELGRSAGRGGPALFIIKHLERFLIKRCAFSVVVNDGIADELSRIHGLAVRPLVVRSTPGLWQTDEAVCVGVRLGWLKELGMPPDTFVMMYHGILKEGRGLETLLRVLEMMPKTALVILGDAQCERYRDGLEAMTRALGVERRLLMLPAVPLFELWHFVGAADAGMVVPLATENYRYMLPNKLFENIHAETPLICSDLPEMAGLVNNYGVGLLAEPGDADSIAAAVERLKNDEELRARIRQNLRLAKTELCWEKEGRVLIDAYKRLYHGED